MLNLYLKVNHEIFFEIKFEFFYFHFKEISFIPAEELISNTIQEIISDRSENCENEL